MYFSPALVLAALPFLVETAPFEESPRDGISIPIAKRSGFRSTDGVVDISKLESVIVIRPTVGLVFHLFFYRIFATFLTTRSFAARLRGV